MRPRNLKWEQNGVLNPAVTVYQNKILLLYRAVGDDNVSRFGVVTTTDGVNFDYASDNPAFEPDPQSTYETRGVEDPRVSFFKGEYWVIYVAASLNRTLERPNATDWKTRVSLTRTKDFVNFERHGVILHSYNDKNAAIFPAMWPDSNGDFYYLYHRRHPGIWLSRSRDLNTWEDVEDKDFEIIEPSKQNWDNDRIGIGSQPIYTEIGWLVFYHGRDHQGSYRLGAFVADYEHPQHILYKLAYPILEPELDFEKNGFIPDVVFTCGAVEAGVDYLVYYGGADFAIGGAYINKKALLEELKKSPIERK